MDSCIKIGVLALQGAVIEHIHMLKQVDYVDACPVRTLDEIDTCDALVIPGGESTTIGRLLSDFALMNPLRQKIRSGFPVWGTCAGMILLAKQIEHENSAHLGVMDITVCRNAYGRQLDSFQTTVPIPKVSSMPVPLVFIRAPYVTAYEPSVDILLEIDSNIVACRQANMLATSFHPELTEDVSFHRYFAQMVRKSIV